MDLCVSASMLAVVLGGKPSAKRVVREAVKLACCMSIPLYLLHPRGRPEAPTECFLRRRARLREKLLKADARLLGLARQRDSETKVCPPTQPGTYTR